MRMTDIIDKIQIGSFIQHGKHNDRVYLMKLSADDDPERVLEEITKLADRYGYSKLICKIPKKAAPLFFSAGYVLEGYIPAFYKGVEDAFFVSRFRNPGRAHDRSEVALSRFYKLLCLQLPEDKYQVERCRGYSVRPLGPPDVARMVEIYADVFESYPFPIHDPDYILETMRDHVRYFGAFKNGVLAALSSAEIDFEMKNAEMTDFATDRLHTGNNLSCLLLEAMEKDMQRSGIKTLYTIARLHSIPMNKTFLRFGYEYSGTLKNNTAIAGKIESMNVYFKHI